MGWYKWFCSSWTPVGKTIGCGTRMVGASLVHYKPCSWCWCGNIIRGSGFLIDQFTFLYNNRKIRNKVDSYKSNQRLMRQIEENRQLQRQIPTAVPKMRWDVVTVVICTGSLVGVILPTVLIKQEQETSKHFYNNILPLISDVVYMVFSPICQGYLLHSVNSSNKKWKRLERDISMLPQQQGDDNEQVAEQPQEDDGHDAIYQGNEQPEGKPLLNAPQREFYNRCLIL